MTSASSLDSELINKIALDFANATSLAVVIVNIHGEEISERFNFTSFCQKMRQDPEHYSRCRMSDRCGGLEASKGNKPCIYRCHADPDRQRSCCRIQGKTEWPIVMNLGYIRKDK